MEAWAKEFIKVWEKNRVLMAEVGFLHLKNNPLLPINEYTLNDATQFLDGTTAMMKEELEGTGNDVRDMYFNTMVPGVLAQGQSTSGFVSQVTLVAVVYASIVLPQMSKKHREKSAIYLATFWGNFNHVIVKTSIEMGAKA